MKSLKTTFLLLACLAVALFFLFLTRQASDLPARPLVSSHPTTLPTSEETHTPNSLPADRDMRRTLARLQKRYSEAFHEWHSKAICNIMLEKNIGLLYCSSSVWAQEQKAYDSYCHYMQETDFNALSGSEIATLQRCFELRKQFHDWQDNDDIPLEAWRELAQEYASLQMEAVGLIRKQYIHDNQMTLGEAMMLFYPDSVALSKNATSAYRDPETGEQLFQIRGFNSHKFKRFPKPPVEDLEDLLPESFAKPGEN